MIPTTMTRRMMKAMISSERGNVGEGRGGVITKMGRRRSPSSRLLYFASREPVNRLRLTPLHGILKPSEWDQEQRRQEVTEQQVHPGQREIKGAKSEPCPERT